MLRSQDRLYLYRDRVYWETSGEEQRMMPSYYIHLNRLRMKARLPDTPLPINPAVSPSAYILWVALDPRSFHILHLRNVLSVCGWEEGGRGCCI